MTMMIPRMLMTCAPLVVGLGNGMEGSDSSGGLDGALGKDRSAASPDVHPDGRRAAQRRVASRSRTTAA